MIVDGRTIAHCAAFYNCSEGAVGSRPTRWTLNELFGLSAHFRHVVLDHPDRESPSSDLFYEQPRLFESPGFFVETSKSRPTRARLRNRELADEAELVSLSVG